MKIDLEPQELARLSAMLEHEIRGDRNSARSITEKMFLQAWRRQIDLNVELNKKICAALDLEPKV